MAVAKDQIRQIITENNITSVADVYSLLKDSFKDILQELLEAEMDATLGYEKIVKVILRAIIIIVYGWPKKRTLHCLFKGSIKSFPFFFLLCQSLFL